ncbi:helix-turn-helix domain-containing protein [Halorhabdus amylolytica]|uniref:hypothetical protein n=1 Tax=Halorhabdus amylolytica TaxID=2559573 RepID=UPI0020BF56FC|nr:hypothetical protein [Halorhabdus amylolytica]
MRVYRIRDAYRALRSVAGPIAQRQTRLEGTGTRVTADTGGDRREIPLPERTVRRALSILTEARLVEERVNFRDASRRRYAPRPVADPAGDEAVNVGWG